MFFDPLGAEGSISDESTYLPRPAHRAGERCRSPVATSSAYARCIDKDELTECLSLISLRTQFLLQAGQIIAARRDASPEYFVRRMNVW